jgi:threonine 3-dehydrogenase
MTIGHEYVGEIAKLGEGVTGLQVGQRVSGEGHLTCHRCRNCRSGNIQWCKDTVSVGVDRDGAFAEYVCIPATNVILIDEAIDEDVVAFFDAFGNATHTALMFPLIGEDVLITGAGPIGIIAQQAIAEFSAGYDSSVTNKGVAHYDLRFLKPLDEDLLHEIGRKFKRIITIEDGVRNGGMGSAVLEWMADHGYTPIIKRLGLPDSFVEHGTVAQLQHITGIDKESIKSAIQESVQEKS